MDYKGSAYAKMEHKENVVNKHGFTLLEVTLFLAISSALALLVFIGLGPRLRNLRFTQSIRSLEASIEQNFSAALSGDNARNEGVCNVSTNLVGGTGTSSQIGTAESCVLNGKLAVFENSQVTYRSIVSLTKQANENNCRNSTNTGFKKLVLSNCYRSVALTNAQETPTIYKYANGLSQSSDITAIGILVNPETAERIIFSGKSTTTGANAYTGRLDNAKFTNFTDSSTAASEVCFAMSGRTVKFAFTNQSLNPELKFDEVCS